MSVQRHVVKQEATLQEFVGLVLAGARPRRIQQLIKFKSVAVNGEVVTRALHPLKAGDAVTIHFGHASLQKATLPGGMKLLFEDESLMVVDKPPGLLTIATDKERTRTAYALLTSHVREETRDEEARVFIVHRLDQGTSGLLVFARTEEIKRQLQDQWKTVEKKYQAVVEGCPRPESDTIRSVLKENTALRVYSTDDEEGDEAITHYRTVQKAGRYCLLEVTIETGRKNQIRVHLSERGHPVVGDAKYGAHGNPIERLALHASHLAFVHPVRQERLVFTSPIPPRMRSLVGSRAATAGEAPAAEGGKKPADVKVRRKVRAEATGVTPPAEGARAKGGPKTRKTFRKEATETPPAEDGTKPAGVKFKRIFRNEAAGETPPAEGGNQQGEVKAEATFRNEAAGETLPAEGGSRQAEGTFRKKAAGKTPPAEGTVSPGISKKRAERNSRGVKSPRELRRSHGKAADAAGAPRQGRDQGETKPMTAAEPGGETRAD